MNTNGWLPLTEYSNKYKVSVSTLRRRIRAERVEMLYQEGKYLLKDASLADHHPNKQREGRKVSPPPQTVSPSSLLPQAKSKEGSTEELVDSAQTLDRDVMALLAELKKAYSLVLQEKEEQVLILKEEVVDLQTLVKVLESENNRLLNQLRKTQENQRLQKTTLNEKVLDDDAWVHTLELE